MQSVEVRLQRHKQAEEGCRMDPADRDHLAHADTNNIL